MMRDRTGYALSLPGVVFILVLMGGPMVIMFLLSLTERAAEGGINWGEWTGLSYTKMLLEEDLSGQTVLNRSYAAIYLRSFLLSLMTTLGCLILGLPVAFWLSLQPPRRRALLVFLFSLPFWVSLLVRNYAFIMLLRVNGLLDQALMGIGLTDQPLGLLYSNIAVAIGLIYSFLPLMVLPLVAGFETFDFRLAEAGFDLGAGRWKTFLHVVLPANRAPIVAGTMLVFIPSLGAYVTPVLLGGSKSLMIGNLIELQFGPARDWPFGAALSFVLLALLALMALLNRLARRR